MPTENILPTLGESYYYPNFFEPQESDLILKELLDKTPWQHQAIKIFGKEIMQPRLTAWYSDQGIEYSYSGIKLFRQEWTPTLKYIKNKVEMICSEKFNSVLLNFYRTQEDSMGWHRDNEKEMGKNPIIASVSFGSPRVFKFRLYHDKKIKHDLTLDHGSLLLMQGETQHFWEHSLPKKKNVLSPRINLTFRKII